MVSDIGRRDNPSDELPIFSENLVPQSMMVCMSWQVVYLDIYTWFIIGGVIPSGEYMCIYINLSIVR